MKSNTYLPALTGIRAIAAFMVFFHHFNQESYPYPLFRLFNEFHTGVTIFFVLSGFLICLRYYNTCEITSDWFRKYLKNRIARIYPMYLLLTIATFAIAWYMKTETIYNGFSFHGVLLLLNIFFLRGFFDDFKFTGVAQGWSLTVEECFYFLAPLFFVRIQKNKNALWILPIVILSIGLLLVVIFSHANFYGFYGNYTFMFLYTFTGRCVEFFIGMSVALVVLKKNPLITSKPYFTYLGLLIMFGSISIMASLPITETRQFGLYHPFGIFTNNVLLPVGIGLFFYGLITELSIVQRFLSTKTMQLLGVSSYIFYLIHIGFISSLSSGWSEKWTNTFYEWMDKKEMTWITEHINPSVVLTLLVFVILNIVSIVLFKCIEEPVNRKIRQSSFLEKRKKGLA